LLGLQRAPGDAGRLRDYRGVNPKSDKIIERIEI
jgi:hypothetical protein